MNTRRAVPVGVRLAAWCQNAQPFASLAKAYARFFNNEARRPRFKKKGKSRDAFYVANDKFRVDGKTISLPRIGKVRMREALRFEGEGRGRDGRPWQFRRLRTSERWPVSSTDR